MRLLSELIREVEAGLDRYDRDLEARTGYNLIQVASHAAGASEDDVRRLPETRAAVVPVTAGAGIIPGFSGAVAAILGHLGLNAFCTREHDVSGIAEAFERGTDLVFAADDGRFVALDVKHGRCVDNATATGRAFAAALELKAGGLSGRRVLVMGLGRVGWQAAAYLAARNALLLVTDADRSRVDAAVRHFGARACLNLMDGIRQAGLVIDATPVPEIIPEEVVTDGLIVAAPGLPLGLSEKARATLGDNLIHDPLQLGVATMALMAVTRTSALTGTRSGGDRCP